MSSTTTMFMRALSSRSASDRSTFLADLAKRLDDERDERERLRDTDTAAVDQLHAETMDWIEQQIRPNAFVTVVLPVKRNARDHQFYLKLWTREAERALWGPSALRIRNHADRCLWLFVHQTITKRDLTNPKSKPIPFHHYHGLLRMPRFSHQFRGHSRPMLKETKCQRMLPLTERCSLMQDALIAASKRTPQPYVDSAVDHLRGADIDVRAYYSGHPTYAFREAFRRLRSDAVRDAMGRLKNDERQPTSTLLDTGDVLILPHLPRTKEKRRCQRPVDPLTNVINMSDSAADRTSLPRLPRQHERTKGPCRDGFARR